jgi:RNA polymerase sigma factor (sigma-70 family)
MRAGLFRMQDDEGSKIVGGLASLFDNHRAELLRFLRARTGSPELAEDLLQDLWIKASEYAAGPIANGRAYLFRMANNLVLDRARARSRAMARDRHWLEQNGITDGLAEDRADPALPADETLARQQEAEILQQAINQLPAGAKRALVLYRLKGHGHLEVAQIMGISRSGVEKHLAVAMKHLRHALADCGFFAAAESQYQDKASGPIPPMEQKS